MEDKYASIPEELIEEINYRLNVFTTATDRLNAGHHFSELHNAVSDLSTYHSGYSDRNGTLPWEREED